MESPILATLGNSAAPPEVTRDLHRPLRWSPEALADLWTVLGPSLRGKLDHRVEAQLDAFSERHHVEGPDLAMALKALRFLLHEAARRDVSWEAFDADLGAVLGDGAAPLAKVLAPRYREALDLVRFDSLRASLLDHGYIYVGSEWRLDAVLASTRVKDLGAHVAMLTMKYRSSTGAEQVTMQVLPADLLQLRRVVDEMIEAAELHERLLLARREQESEHEPQR
ncbi:MAG: hypothetical protein U0271_19420 [Polyangiaceae bacterium]